MASKKKGELWTEFRVILQSLWRGNAGFAAGRTEVDRESDSLLRLGLRARRRRPGLRRVRLDRFSGSRERFSPDFAKKEQSSSFNISE